MILTTSFYGMNQKISTTTKKLISKISFDYNIMFSSFAWLSFFIALIDYCVK